MVYFTAQEKRIIDALGDGKPHSIEELMQYLWDEESPRKALINAVSRIRKKLLPYNQFIHCIEAYNGSPSCYVHAIPTAMASVKSVKSVKSVTKKSGS